MLHVAISKHLSSPEVNIDSIHTLPLVTKFWAMTLVSEPMSIRVLIKVLLPTSCESVISFGRLLLAKFSSNAGFLLYHILHNVTGAPQHSLAKQMHIMAAYSVVTHLEIKMIQPVQFIFPGTAAKQVWASSHVTPWCVACFQSKEWPNQEPWQPRDGSYNGTNIACGVASTSPCRHQRVAFPVCLLTSCRQRKSEYNTFQLPYWWLVSKVLIFMGIVMLGPESLAGPSCCHMQEYFQPHFVFPSDYRLRLMP